MSEFVVPSVPDLPEPVHIDPSLIAFCELCDDEGYRGNRVCDHVDHAPAAERGMAKVRAVLAKGGES